MPSKKDGVMIILSSPSGAGKTTLVKMLSVLDNFEISISHTTRQPRPNETHNKDYYFVSEKEFERLIKNEEFLEYAKVFNNFSNISLVIAFLLSGLLNLILRILLLMSINKLFSIGAPKKYCKKKIIINI